VLEVALHRRASNTPSTHHIATPSAAARGRVVVAAVAAGACLAAGQAMNNTESPATISDDPTLLASAREVTAATGLGGRPPAPEYLPVTQPSDPAAVEAVQEEAVQAMAKGERLVAERAAREAEARRPLFVLPTIGRLTSGYGARWGTTHWGIDIANSIGTPIVAAADGVVVESGPASGFGLWVRLLHADGTSTVYGHINRALVSEGDQVRAGDEIAEMGNRGHSTGPHLHFEVWNPDGAKVNPLTWLLKHGIEL
jgi:murein DD-endopeptidase MepM/ murein hydrolase activator NlpD